MVHGFEKACLALERAKLREAGRARLAPRSEREENLTADGVLE